jgi:uncharacterized protein YciI
MGVFALTAQLPPGLTTYQLVLLKKGPAYAEGTDAAKQLLQQHGSYMMKLGAEGASLVAGPFAGSEEIIGVMVVRADAPEKAEAVERADPAVKAGFFVIEVAPFAASSDAFHAWAQPFERETLYFGFLIRGPNRGQDATTAAELQKQHLAFMDGQHKEGRLVMAGPFLQEGTRRGIVVYRAGSLDEARSRASGDPMIKAGRLALELHPWAIPRWARP